MLARPSFWRGRNLSLLYVFFCYKNYSEGFPTSGNDRITETVTPKQRFKEFFDYNEISGLI
jgi:hypothetical protein